MCFVKRFAAHAGKGLRESWAAVRRFELFSVKNESWFSGKANTGLGYSPCYEGRGGESRLEELWNVAGILEMIC